MVSAFLESVFQHEPIVIEVTIAGAAASGKDRLEPRRAALYRVCLLSR
jgi:hypothetical protein